MISSFVLILFLLTALSCNRPSQATKEEQPELKTYKVTSQEVQTYIEATGSVQPGLEGTAKILSYLPGAVDRIFVQVGDRVQKGDPLVAITSPEVTDTYSSYLSTLTQLKQAERVYNLNKQLFEIGAITRNDLLNAEATYKQLTTVAEGMKNKLRIYGTSTDEEVLTKNRPDTILIKAPLTGYVADIQIHIGDKVDTATPLMTIADPHHNMIVANIYDTDIPKVKKGSNVTFYVDAFPNTPFKGVISYVSDVSDADSKTVKTFIKIQDTGKELFFKQNMFLKLKIEGEKRVLPLIPKSAIVYKDGKFYVYCPTSTKAQKCEPNEITPVREVSDSLMAVEGLKDGQEIVLTAIDLEKP
jgi:cobalt-zinc-cadmium efflux system membrane fusion protein